MPSAYLVNGNSNDVSVVDVASLSVVGTITVGNGPRGAAVTPDLSTVYVTNYTDGTVSIIDAGSATVTGTITVGNGPGGICVDAKGQVLLVTNFLDGTVSVIAIPANTVTGTVTLPTHFAGATTEPYAVCISPDSSTGYVATQLAGSHSTGFVEVINIAGLSVTASVNEGSSQSATPLQSIQGICIAPDGLHVYVTNQLSGDITVIITSSNTILTTMTDVIGEPRSICILPNQSAGFWNGSAGELIVFNPATNVITHTLSLGGSDQLTGIAPTSDSAFVMVGDAQTGTGSEIWKVVTSTLATSNLTTGKNYANGIGLSIYPSPAFQIVMIV